MTEADLVAQIQAGRYNLGFFISLILSAHSVMIIATHYFLGKERLLLKAGVFAIYSAGYAGLLSLYQWEITQVSAAGRDLRALTETAAPNVVNAITSWSGGPASLQTWLPWIVYLASYLMVAFYLFAYNHTKGD